MIINPWFFYVLQLTSSIRNLLAILGACAIAASVVFFIENDVSAKNYRIKPWLISACVFFALFAVFPTKDTLLLMKACEFVTYDNVQITVDAFKQAIDYAATLF